ncbi:transcription initiation factor IIB family protein [Haloarchaeobius sp. HME9146]|uniref:transcription initiation factor IIB n=1 Tax=Haloarchaeobius sp. HME9146 TaxID=2978732 RepID=UPI0021BF0986|nr:transcription initiation factor IIB family protein [Haloarchaeobius sp. HME9146]
MTRDSKGNQLSARERRRVYRMQREHHRGRWQSTAEQNLSRGCREVSRLSGMLDLSRTVREEASTLFRAAQTADLLLGRSVEAMAAACVYATCRCRGLGRTREEVLCCVECPAGLVDACYRALQKQFQLDTQPTSYDARLSRLLSELDVPDDLSRRARELGRRAREQGLTNGRRPSGIAAACLYLAVREARYPLTQKAIADAAGSTATTLRARYRELSAADSIAP